jgi:hypothetical protein
MPINRPSSELDIQIARALTEVLRRGGPEITVITPEMRWAYRPGGVGDYGISIAIGPPMDGSRLYDYSVYLIFKDGSVYAYHPFDVFPVVSWSTPWAKDRGCVEEKQLDLFTL